MQAPALLQDAEQTAQAAAQQGNRRGALLVVVWAGCQVTAACQIYNLILSAATQPFSEGYAMRLLAAAVAPLQAAPAALGTLRLRPWSEGVSSKAIGSLLMHCTKALGSLLEWLTLPTVPPRIRQLAERRTLAAPVLISWLRSTAPVAESLCKPTTGDH
jgi:hypothetical protein